MRIVYIGKWPPILGGTCNQTYWTLNELGKRGHEITVVSNCMEVEETYRCKLDEKDIEMLQPKNVKLKSTLPVKTPRFIPQNNPYMEKISSLATEAVEELGPDLILSRYFQPYSLAGHYVSKLTNLKHVVMHAGSDITRLLHYPQLNKINERMLRDATAVLTNEVLSEFFKDLGATPITLNYAPAEILNPYDENLELPSQIEHPERTVLFLGKISKAKGIEYAINALSDVDEAHLVIVGSGKTGFLERLIDERKLGNRVCFLGALPHWRVPSIIRQTKTTIIPEYNFGVNVHRSSLPMEAMLCGKRPLVSNQVTRLYGELGEKYMTEIDPIDRNSMAVNISLAIEEDYDNDSVKEAYREIRYESGGEFENFIDQFENILKDIASR